jgi:phosphatidylglycerophosphatase A
MHAHRSSLLVCYSVGIDAVIRLERSQAYAPPVIVIDELAGFAAAAFLTYSVSGLVVAFVLFRFFDIAKVFPAAKLETVPGGAGIVLDDTMAGIYTLFILRLYADTSLI